jgi:hypothetical protein
MIGRVPAPSSGGPWIVRAEVHHDDGTPLGRNFLEVARRPRPRPPSSAGEAAAR